MIIGTAKYLVDPIITFFAAANAPRQADFILMCEKS